MVQFNVTYIRNGNRKWLVKGKEENGKSIKAYENLLEMCMLVGY